MEIKNLKGIQLVNNFFSHFAAIFVALLLTSCNSYECLVKKEELRKDFLSFYLKNLDNDTYIYSKSYTSWQNTKVTIDAFGNTKEEDVLTMGFLSDQSRVIIARKPLREKKFIDITELSFIESQNIETSLPIENPKKQFNIIASKSQLDNIKSKEKVLIFSMPLFTTNGRYCFFNVTDTRSAGSTLKIFERNKDCREWKIMRVYNLNPSF